MEGRERRRGEREENIYVRETYGLVGSETHPDRRSWG